MNSISRLKNLVVHEKEEMIESTFTTCNLKKTLQNIFVEDYFGYLNDVKKYARIIYG